MPARVKVYPNGNVVYDAEEGGGGSGNAELWDVLTAHGFVDSDYTLHNHWLAWENDVGNSYDGSTNLIDVDSVSSDSRYIYFPGSSWYKVEFSMVVPEDPQVTVTTPKRWDVIPYTYYGSPGSWTSQSAVSPGINSYMFQWNCRYDARQGAAEQGNETIWINYYNFFFHSPYQAVAFNVYQTFPTGDAGADYQEPAFSQCKITQVYYPTFPPAF